MCEGGRREDMRKPICQPTRRGLGDFEKMGRKLSRAGMAGTDNLCTYAGYDVLVTYNEA